MQNPFVRMMVQALVGAAAGVLAGFLLAFLIFGLVLVGEMIFPMSYMEPGSFMPFVPLSTLCMAFGAMMGALLGGLFRGTPKKK